MSQAHNRYVSRAGLGKPGYCVLCSFADVAKLNKNLAAGWNARQVGDWLRENYDGMTVTRQTIYNHRDNHAKRAEDRVVTAVERMKSDTKALMPRVSSNEEYLEAIRDLGYRRAVENPEEVTIDHGLKAAQILSSQKRSGGDTLILLARVMTGGDWRSEVVIEGEAREVEVAPAT